MSNLIGKFAINFTAPAVLSDGTIVDNYSFYKNIEGKYVFLFFYPMDFTFVCPSELIAIDNRIKQFRDRNIEVIAVSTDSQFVHSAWRKTSRKMGGIGNVSYTLVADTKKDIIKNYHLKDDKSGVSYRGTFIIDDEKKIRIQHIHDFPIGRNIDEYLRLFDAISFYKRYGNVCQAGWTKGNKGIKPSSEGIGEFLNTDSDKL